MLLRILDKLDMPFDIDLFSNISSEVNSLPCIIWFKSFLGWRYVPSNEPPTNNPELSEKE